MADARGDYLRFLDSDDAFDPDSTSRLLELSTNGLTISYGATEYCDVELRPCRTVVCTLRGTIRDLGLTDFTVTLPSLRRRGPQTR